jgi:hypothetical protein
MGSEVFELQELDCKMQDRLSQWFWWRLPFSEQFHPVYTTSCTTRQKAYRVNVIECDVIGMYAYTLLLMVYSHSDHCLFCLPIWHFYMINVTNYDRKVKRNVFACEFFFIFFLFTLYLLASIKKSMLNLTGGMCMHTRWSSKCSQYCKDYPRL